MPPHTTTLALPLTSLAIAHVAFAAAGARTTRQVRLALPPGRCVVDVTGAPATAEAESFRVTADGENGVAGRVEVIGFRAELVPWGEGEERGDEGVSGGEIEEQQQQRQHQEQTQAQDPPQMAYRVHTTLLLQHKPTADETHHSDTDSERTIVATSTDDGDMESADMSTTPPLSVSLSLSYTIPSAPDEQREAQRPRCQQDHDQTHTQRQRRRLFPLLPLPLGFSHSHEHKDKHHGSGSSNSSNSTSPLASPITSPTAGKSKSKGKGKSKSLFGLGTSQRSVEDAEREIHALFGLENAHAGQSLPHATHAPRRSVEHSQRTIETLLGLETRL